MSVAVKDTGPRGWEDAPVLFHLFVHPLVPLSPAVPWRWARRDQAGG